MAKIKQDFDLFAGEDKDIKFTITDENDVAVDLTTGVTEIIWVCARLASEQQNLIVKRKDLGISVATNVITVALTFTDTDQLNGKYRHELRMVKDGAESVLAIGQCQVYNSLTKSL